MKQKCYRFYCDHLKKEIGDGFYCFHCSHIERGEDGKMCKHEVVMEEYTREV